MIKKFFIGICITAFCGALLYQQKYLSSLQKESQQISAQNTDSSKLVVGKGVNFYILFYDKKGLLNAKMSGENITYYEDATFEAKGNLVYSTFDADDKPVNTIHTNIATGIFEVEDENLFLLSGDRQLKSLILPEDITFDFNGNKGKTKNVFIDAINRTISSKEHIESQGPNGKFSADGFFYDINTKDFTFNSEVRGLYQNTEKNKH